MSYEPNTSLNLSLCNNELNLDLILNRSSFSSSPPFTPSEPRVFSCNYCRRKFYSSQALGGHQNAHKLERTLAKKSRELSSAIRNHSGSNNRPGSGSGYGRYTGEISYGRREMDQDWNRGGYKPEVHHVHQDDYSQIDLSLRL